MGRLYHTNYCEPVHSQPRGHLIGASLIFPAPVGKDPITGKPKMQYMRFPVQAQIVRVLMPAVVIPDTHWAAKYAGTERLSIKCRLKVGTVDETIYLDGAQTQDLYNATIGQGIGVRQLPDGVTSALSDQSGIAAFYRVDYVGQTRDDGGAWQKTYRVVRGGGGDIRRGL